MATPEQLGVWLGDERVGHLVPGRRDFRYAPAPGSRPLTVNPAGVEEPWDVGFGRAWFAGLLPEGEQRTAAERRHRVERGDTFGLLAAIGWECAGAVSVLPPGRTPAGGHYRPLAEEEVSARLDAAPGIVDEIDLEVRHSLGGVQDKVLLTRDDKGWQLPLEGAPSSHILKPEPARFAGLVLGEAWALVAAAAVTTAAQAEVRRVVDHRPALVVTRYDRVRTDDGLRRLHQEDLCQVIGFMPDQKYENEGGPGLAECCQILDMYSSQPILDKQAIIKWVIFNYFIGNANAHGKNLSLIREIDGSIRLAPFYDLISTRAYPEISKKMAMKIGKETRFDWIMERHWRLMADQLDLKFSYLKGLFKEMAETLEKDTLEMADSIILEFNGEKRIQKICGIIKTHILHVKTYL